MIKSCKKCGKEFNSTKEHKYWCEDCYNKTHKKVGCLICGTEFVQKYQNESCCSKKCAAIMRGNFKNPDVLKKIELTNLKKYGVDNPWKNKDIQQKCNLNNDRSKQSEAIKQLNEERYRDSRHRKKLSFVNGQKSKKASVIFDTLKNSSLPYLQNVVPEKTFDDCVFRNKLRFDFYCPSADINIDGCTLSHTPFLIEYDGEQHYHPVRFNDITDAQMYKNFITTQVKDWYKDFYCITHDIPLIRIKYCTKSNPSFDEIYNNGYIIGRAQCSDNIIDVFDINEVDCVNNKNITFTVYAGISCTFKCCPNNPQICQNNSLCQTQPIRYDIDKIIHRYQSQALAHCVTIQGLEPLDNLKQVLWFIYHFRLESNDPIYLWTGYNKDECEDLIYLIQQKMEWDNIIIKFGRFVPNQQAHYDDVLGIKLVSDNQHAEVIS